MICVGLCVLYMYECKQLCKYVCACVYLNDLCRAEDAYTLSVYACVSVFLYVYACIKTRIDVLVLPRLATLI